MKHRSCLFFILLFGLLWLHQSSRAQDEFVIFLPAVFEQQPPRPGAVTFTSHVQGSAENHTDMETAPTGELYIANRGGIVSLVNADNSLTTFLDLSELVFTGSFEAGFFDVIFHPDYVTNRQFFVSYFHRDAVAGEASLRIVRYTAINANTVDLDSATIILDVEQESGSHQAGTLAFSPVDGYLYIAVGDDAMETNAQDGMSLKGKLLRIDVNSAEPYAIPPDNPFVDDPSIRDEIWALGLRNPWAISFDPATGDLYIPDVGQVEMEEINYQSVTAGGGQNYGWPCLEGTLPYQATACESGVVYTPPIHTYRHGAACSVTGGVVYHGRDLPDLEGSYLFGDFCTTELFALRYEVNSWSAERIGFGRNFITKFGTDVNGEVLLGYLDLDIVDRLIPNTSATTK